MDKMRKRMLRGANERSCVGKRLVDALKGETHYCGPEGDNLWTVLRIDWFLWKVRTDEVLLFHVWRCVLSTSL